MVPVEKEKLEIQVRQNAGFGHWDCILKRKDSMLLLLSINLLFVVLLQRLPTTST